MWGAQAEEQSQATAYIKSDGIAAVRKSSTTNLIPYSEDLSQWTTFRSSVALNQIISPDGTLSADKIIQELGQTNSGGVFANTQTLLNTTVYTYSVFLKAGGYNLACFRVNDNQYAWFDLSDGTVGSLVRGENSSIENHKNGWYRCSFTFTTTTTLGKPHIYIADSDGSLVLSGSDGVKGIYAWGAQLEQQTQAETYAKTTGLPVTIDLFTENNYGTMTNMSSSDIVEDTPNN